MFEFEYLQIMKTINRQSNMANQTTVKRPSLVSCAYRPRPQSLFLNLSQPFGGDKPLFDRVDVGVPSGDASRE